MPTATNLSAKIEHACEELRRYIGNIAPLCAESVVWQFESKGRDIRDYFLVEEMVFDRHEYECRANLVWRRRT